VAEPLANLVLAGLPGAIMAVDLDDRVTVWNDGATRLFGWTPEEVLGRTLPIVPDDLRAVRAEWMARAAAGEEIETLTQRVDRHGRRHDVVLRYAAIRDPEGRLVGTAVLCRDASSQLQTASELERSEAELALVRRLAGLAHRLLQDLDLNGVLQSLVEVAVDLLRTDSGVLSLEQEPGAYIRMTNVNIPDDLADHRIAPGEGLHGLVLERGEPVIVNDYDTWPGAVDAFRDRGFHAALAVPMKRGGRVIGVLSVHHQQVGRAELVAVEVDRNVRLAGRTLNAGAQPRLFAPSIGASCLRMPRPKIRMSSSGPKLANTSRRSRSLSVSRSRSSSLRRKFANCAAVLRRRQPSERLAQRSGGLTRKCDKQPRRDVEVEPRRGVHPVREPERCQRGRSTR
jgi:PAS domain S-box-containing protein